MHPQRNTDPSIPAILDLGRSSIPVRAPRLLSVTTKKSKPSYFPWLRSENKSDSSNGFSTLYREEFPLCTGFPPRKWGWCDSHLTASVHWEAASLGLGSFPASSGHPCVAWRGGPRSVCPRPSQLHSTVVQERGHFVGRIVFVRQSCVSYPVAEAAGLGYSGEFSPQRLGMRKVQVLKVIVQPIFTQALYRQGWAKVGSQLLIWKRHSGYDYYSGFMNSVSCPHNCKCTFVHPYTTPIFPTAREGSPVLSGLPCMWPELCTRQLQGTQLTFVIFGVLYIYIAAIF